MTDTDRRNQELRRVWITEPPEGEAWICPEPGCEYWATIGGNAAFHAETKSHAAPVLGPIPAPLRELDPDDPVRFLLDGLGVESLAELKQLVDAGRTPVRMTPNQREAIAAMFPATTVIVRDGRLPGAVHVEPVGDDLRATLLSPDCSKRGGCLGISYDALVSLPEGEPR